MSNKDKYGFIDINGKCKISPKYKKAFDFSEGLACVEDSLGYAYINIMGKIVFRSNNLTDFKEGLGYNKINSAITFIDKSGNTVVKPIYKSYIVGCSGQCDSYYSEGLAPVVLTINDTVDWHNFIYINKQGNKVFEQEFKIAQNFNQGLAFVVYNDNIHGYINKFGKIAIQLDSNEYGEMFSEGLALVTNSQDSCYFIDKNGKKLKGVFHRAEHFSNGMAAITFNMWNSNYGYIDTSGNVIIKPQYSYVTDFYNGYATVGKVLNGKYISYIIDKMGNVKYGPYENTHFLKFTNGLAFGEKQLKNNLIEQFYINTDGKIVWKDSFYVKPNEKETNEYIIPDNLKFDE